MKRILQFGGVLWLAAGLGLAADQKGGGAPKTPPPARAPKNEGGAPKGGRAVNPPLRMSNPNALAPRLYQMKPEERERVIEKLPPARQEQLRRNLAYFDSLPKQQQQILIQRAERLASMPPEREREVRQSFQAFQKLEPDRKKMIQGALVRMQNLTDEQRTQLTNSDAFKNRFSPEEQKIIQDLADIMMPPL
jgi:hypothetical protein